MLLCSCFKFILHPLNLHWMQLIHFAYYKFIWHSVNLYCVLWYNTNPYESTLLWVIINPVNCHFVSWISCRILWKNIVSYESMFYSVISYCIFWIHIAVCFCMLRIRRVTYFLNSCYEFIFIIHVMNSYKIVLGLINPYCIPWAHIGSLKWYCTLFHLFCIKQTHILFIK